MEDKTVFQPGPTGSISPGVRLNGTYEVERLIAEGGMGEVYKGFNIQTGDPVAIKVIRTELSRNPDALALFRREASTLNNLHHDAIVRYYVFSVDPILQRAYLAMEFVDGPSLASRIASQPLALAEVDVFRARLGLALDAAHRLGVVHRDISSDNFILPDGDVARAKIIDFGIARWRRPGEGTIIGDGLAGKYNYMSPEQLGLFGGEVTAKSDIYSFGLVLAEASRGRRIDMDGSQIEIIEKRRKVPDLSDIHASLRPLLQSMLQPNPADRPADMAAVVAWRAGPAPGSAPSKPRGDAPAPAPRTSSGGRLAAGLGALIVLASLGTTAYVFRDVLGSLLFSPGGKSSPTPTPTPTAPPPTSSLTFTPTSTPTPTLTPTPTPIVTPAPGSIPTNTTVPGPDALKDELPPRAPQLLVQLPPAALGSPYHAEIPAFKDPGGKGLQLEAIPPPPNGLSFVDHHDGSAEITGVPTKPGVAAFEVVATNHKGRSARMNARIEVAGAGSPPTTTPSRARPPTPAQAMVALESATVGSDYVADLPPFNPGDSKGLALRAEPEPPEGLRFVDGGGGLSQISGKPTRAGSFDFDVVASDASGQTARMSVRIVVAPAPSPLSSLEISNAFVRAYDGGPCFAVRPGASGDGARTLEAIGDDMTAFQRFDREYKRLVGGAATATFKHISPAQCPILELLKSSASGAVPEPRVELAHFEVGGSLPLAGTVSGIAGRRLALLAIGEDGAAHLISVTADGGVASFSEPMGRVDDASIGPLQMLVAIVSDRPLAALDNFRKGGVGVLAPKLMSEWESAGASARAELFQFKK